MRDYGVVRTRFWDWAKRKGLSMAGRELALYLLTSPHGNSLGCFRLPLAYICEDLGKGMETVSETLSELSRNGFIDRDDATGWTWLTGFLEHNPVPNRNVGKAIEKQIEGIPVDLPLFGRMIDGIRQYARDDDRGLSSDLLDKMAERFRNRSDTVSAGYRNQIQTQTQEQIQNQGQTHTTATPDGEARDLLPDSQDARRAYDAWNEAAKLSGRWPVCRLYDDARRKALLRCMAKLNGFDGFTALLQKALDSRFLRQEMNGFGLDWLLKPANFKKVSEGNYDNHESDGQGSRGEGQLQPFACGGMSGPEPTESILD